MGDDDTTTRTGDSESTEEASGRDPIDALAARMHDAVSDAEFAYDPDFMRSAVAFARRWNAYFASEVRGAENIPADGPALLVANHSGGFFSPDTGAVVEAWYDRRGVDDPLVMLSYDLLFAVPYISDLIGRIGGVPASSQNAEDALNAGSGVLVYPGGDWEVYRPVWHRNRIDFHDRRGFVKLALRTGVPVLPVVGHGAHNTTWIVVRGDRIARAMTVDRRLRIKIFPFSAFPPLGVLPSYLPHVPLPAKIRVDVGAPLDWSRYGPDATDDPEIVGKCYDEITGQMQRTLTRLSGEERFPVVTRAREAATAPFRAIGRLAGRSSA